MNRFSTLWARNRISSCPLLYTDSSGIGGITPAHHSTAGNRVSKISSIWYSLWPLQKNGCPNQLIPHCCSRQGQVFMGSLPYDAKCPDLHQNSLFHTSSETASSRISFSFTDTFWGHVHYLSSHCHTSFSSVWSLPCQHQVTRSNCFPRTTNTMGLHSKCATWR